MLKNRQEVNLVTIFIDGKQVPDASTKVVKMLFSLKMDQATIFLLVSTVNIPIAVVDESSVCVYREGISFAL